MSNIKQSLTNVSLPNNALISLNLSGFSGISQLNLQTNGFFTMGESGLNIDGCNSLYSVDLKYNFFSKVDFSQKTLLNTLDCDQNPNLNEINVSGCSNLVNLFYDKNIITGLNLSECTSIFQNQQSFRDYPQLRYLNLSKNNNVGYYQIAWNPELSSLDLSESFGIFYIFASNNISEVNLNNFKGSYISFMGPSKISGLDFSTCANLGGMMIENHKGINSDNITLSDSPPAGSKYLWISNCSLDSLDFISSNWYTNGNLSEFMFYGNNLTNFSIPNTSNVINWVDCSNNQITGIYGFNNNISYFACQYNLITGLNLAGGTNLQNVDCRNNPLKSINVSGCSNLGGTLYGYPNFYFPESVEDLNISQTAFQNFDFLSNCPNLKKLTFRESLLINSSYYVINNSMSLEYLDLYNLNKDALQEISLYIQSLPLLSYLNLRGCKLHLLALSSTKLSELDLSETTIQQIDLYYNTDLISISLPSSITYFRTISSKFSSLSFTGYPNLSYLILVENELNTLQISNCPSLSQLIIQVGGAISAISLSIDNLNNVTYFYFSGVITESSIENLLYLLDNNGLLGGTAVFNLSAGSGSISSAAISSKESLESKGWAVTFTSF